MDIVNFQCQKRYMNELDNWNQQRFIIKQVCGRDFSLFNLVEIDFIYFDQNFLFIVIICFVLLPVLFKILSYIIQRYFCKQIIYLSKQHKYGPTFSAAFIVSLAVNFRVLLNSWKWAKRLSTLPTKYGGQVFQVLACICIGTYLLAPKGDDYFQLQKFGISFNVYYLLISLLVLNFVVTFELPLLVKFFILFVVYIGYLVGSKISDEKDSEEQMQIEYDFEEEEDEENEFVSVNSQDSQITQLQKPKVQKLQLNNVLVKDNEQNNDQKKETSFFEMFFLMIVLGPIRVLFRFIYCSIHNPFMETKLRFIIIAISATNVFLMFSSLLNDNLSFYGVLTLYVGIIFYCLFINEGKFSVIFFEVLAILSVIRFINFIMMLLLDLLFFIQYYNNGNYVVNHSLISNIPQVFFNVYTIYQLSRQKEFKLALLSLFSCSIVNITLFTAIYVATIYLYDVGYFRIFFFNYRDTDLMMAILSKNYVSFFIILNVVLLMVVVLFRIYLQINDYKFDRLIGNGLIICFSAFYTTSLLISLTS